MAVCYVFSAITHLLVELRFLNIIMILSYNSLGVYDRPFDRHRLVDGLFMWLVIR